MASLLVAVWLTLGATGAPPQVPLSPLPVVAPPPILVPSPPIDPSKAGASTGVAMLFSADDYPVAAIRAGEEGLVIADIEIGTEGRATGCKILGSSGSATLDQATCAIIQRRARFKPAFDREGRPVVDHLTVRIRWVLPETEPVDTALGPVGRDDGGREHTIDNAGTWTVIRKYGLCTVRQVRPVEQATVALRFVTRANAGQVAMQFVEKADVRPPENGTAKLSFDNSAAVIHKFASANDVDDLVRVTSVWISRKELDQLLAANLVRVAASDVLDVEFRPPDAAVGKLALGCGRGAAADLPE